MSTDMLWFGLYAFLILLIFLPAIYVWYHSRKIARQVNAVFEKELNETEVQELMQDPDKFMNDLEKTKT